MVTRRYEAILLESGTDRVIGSSVHTDRSSAEDSLAEKAMDHMAMYEDESVYNWDMDEPYPDDSDGRERLVVFKEMEFDIIIREYQIG